jgi:cholesterol oxidase
MERLSSRPEEMEQTYEVVIVGSGYGGSIMASRLARAGKKVCLVERGAEKLPGEYPDSAVSAADDWQLHTADDFIGNEQGLYELHVDDDINVFKGCGLGGTSLINAGVAIEPDPRVWDNPRWPVELRASASLMAPFFDHARKMLGSTPYPDDELLKTTLLRRQAAGIGPFSRPSINVTFTEGVNPAGVSQPACTGCGDCVSGCNVGAKNTLLMNYLPDAQRFGAKIFTGVDVQYVSPSDGKWAVHYGLLGAGRDRFGDELLTVVGDIVILAAGALGSTDILLRSAAQGLPVSGRLGTGFSGNGDVLGFAFDCDEHANAVGWGHEHHTHRHPVGPCITGLIDCRDPDQPLDEGIIIEEGAIPGALAHLMPEAFAAACEEQSLLRQLKGRIQAIVEGAYHGPIARTQTFLVMGHDDGGGKMELEKDKLRIRWPGVGGQPVFARINDTLKKASETVHGSFIPNPVWHEMLRQPLITVHPLGGCPMGSSAADGVVDHIGTVFSGTGAETHPGLYVSDGSIIPVPLGVNPLLTISALAERAAVAIAALSGLSVTYDTAPLKPAATPSSALLLEFTERMTGWVAAGTSDPETGLEQGMAAKTSMWYDLSMAGDALASARDPSTPATISGVVGCAALEEGDLSVEGGRFQLFVPVDDVGDSRMLYEIPLRGPSGKQWVLKGHKNIREGEPWDLWHATTTLYVQIHSDTADGPIWGAGVLRIHPFDFVKQLTTMKVTGPAPLPERLLALATYGRMFAGHLFDYYAGPIGWHHLHPAVASPSS